MKKKIVYLIAGLMIATTMSAAMVGCDSNNEPTSSPTSTTSSSAGSTTSKTESKTQSTGTTFTSSDNSYSFTIPEGFTETDVPAGTVPAGATGAAFTNADNVVLVSVATKGGSANMTGITKDTIEQQLQAQYPGAKISDFTTEKKGNGNVFTYKLQVTSNGTSVAMVQSTYTDADRSINFSMTGADSSKIDTKIVKSVIDSLEIK